MTISSTEAERGARTPSSVHEVTVLAREDAPEKPSPKSATDVGPEALPATLARLRSSHRRKGPPTYEERMALLARLERSILDEKEAIAAAIAADFGSRSRHESLIADVFTTVMAIRYAKKHLAGWMAPEARDVDLSFLPATAEVRPQPVGVVGIIAPWNYPFQLVFSPLVGALAAGNRAMIKPSELTPKTSELVAKIVRTTFDDDHVAVVTGGPELGEAFASLPFDHLVFTGSTKVGRLVMKAAAEHLTPLTLELGGKSPAIVGQDVDLDEAAKKIVMGKLFNAGQTCIAPDYALVPRGKLDAFLEACKRAVRAMYPTLAKNPDYTSIVHERHFERLLRVIKDAETKGARVIEVNPANETLDASSKKIAPTFVVGAKDDALVLSEEIFGPILPLVPYDDLESAIDYINDRARPLALYYFGWRHGDIERVVNGTMSGGVSINGTMLHCAVDDLPFGGIGESGMGAYHAKEGFDSFTKKRPIFHQARLNATGLLRPPFGTMVDLFLKMQLR